MFAAKITTQISVETEQATEAMHDLLSCWYKNGQIIGNSWIIAEVGRTLEAYVVLPERDALEPIHSNNYVLQSAIAVGLSSVTILGPAPNLPLCCACESRSALVLFTHYMTDLPPVRCLDCFAPVPLYRLPYVHDEEHLDLLHWAADYRACDTLQMHCTTGERFGEHQLVGHDTSLSRNGRTLCAELERVTGTPVYYFLHKTRSRSRKHELTRHCPSCNSDWSLKKRLHGFDYRCDTCRLLSAIAADAF